MIELLLTTRTVPGVGTFGELTHKGVLVCVTVERDWQNNQRNVSCIPAGVYEVRPHDSPSKGRCLSLSCPEAGVTIYGPSQRTHCLVHPATFPHELEGCIAPGLSFHPTHWGVANSREAMANLLNLIREPAILTIVRH